MGADISKTMSEEQEEIERAFKIVDSDEDGIISQSELHLYLFGLGCNLTKSQMNDCPASCDEATARAKYEEYKPEEAMPADHMMLELRRIMSTWDETGDGKVAWSHITAPL